MDWQLHPTNALWSVFLVVLVVGVMWYKMHLMRKEIHQLTESLPTIGSQFIRAQLVEVKADLDTTRARVTICEQKLGLNGPLGGP